MKKLALVVILLVSVFSLTTQSPAQAQFSPPVQHGPPVVQRPRTQLPQDVPLNALDQMRRELADLNTKVAQLQKQLQALQVVPQQISQMQQHTDRIDVSLKIAYDNGRLTSDTLKTYCHSLADDMDKSYIIDVSQRRLAANCSASLLRIK